MIGAKFQINLYRFLKVFSTDFYRIRSMYHSTCIKKEINDTINMTTKELEDLIKQEWEVYFPLFSRVTDLEKITKNKTVDDKTIEEMRSLQSMRM